MDVSAETLKNGYVRCPCPHESTSSARVSFTDALLVKVNEGKLQRVVEEEENRRLKKWLKQQPYYRLMEQLVLQREQEQEQKQRQRQQRVTPEVTAPFPYCLLFSLTVLMLVFAAIGCLVGAYNK